MKDSAGMWAALSADERLRLIAPAPCDIALTGFGLGIRSSELMPTAEQPVQLAGKTRLK